MLIKKNTQFVFTAHKILYTIAVGVFDESLKLHLLLYNITTS